MILSIRNSLLIVCLCLATAPHGWAAPFSIISKDRQEYLQARQAYDQANYEQAVTELAKYIYKTKNIKRREARAYRLLGLSYEHLNKPEKALEIYLEALEFHQTNVPLLLAAASLDRKSTRLNSSH